MRSLTFVGVLLAASFAAAQPPGTPSIVTPQQATTLVETPGIVVLHVGDKAEYDKEHLPGARHLEVRAIAATPAPGQLTLQVPADAELETRLEALGIGDKTPIRVYWGKDWVSPTTRVVFTLDYAGLGGQTFVMDGGLPAWKAANLPVTSAVPPAPTPGSLTIAPRPGNVADLATVKATAGTAAGVVIDARATEYYTGENSGNGRIPRPGHVAGAVSLPYTTFVRDDGSFKSVAEVEAMFKAAGAAPGSRVITYCHIGQQATVPWMMARMLGYDAKLFDGSYEEWAKTTDAPVKTGTTP